MHARIVSSRLPRVDDLTISIGTFDNYKIVKKCLSSIYENSPNLKFKVFVVDNDSSDDSVSRLASEFPQATFIKAKSKLGFCGTHNLVIRRSQSRYVLVLDDDTIILKGTLKKMVAFMDDHREIGIAGCKTLNPDRTFQKSYGLFPSLKTELLIALKLSDFWPDSLYKDNSSVQEVEWINGPFMLVRSELLKEVGAFDEHYFTIVCEADWCYRIRKAGWKVVFVPEAEIIHSGGFITGAKDYATLIRTYVNRFYFFYKHYGRIASIMLRLIMMLGAILRIIYFLSIYFLQRHYSLEARKRIKVAWQVIKLSLSRYPYNFPEE